MDYSPSLVDEVASLEGPIALEAPGRAARVSPPRSRAPLASYLTAHARTSGYRVENEALYRVWNLTFAAAMLIVALPLMIVVVVALLLTQGNPFYRGVRIGRNGQDFHIYKFRTLVPDAAKATSDRVLPAGAALTTPLGHFLRDVRIDELPQLFNVIKGDMNLFGPRPVRPAIASICAAQIANYNDRFQIRPGIFGHPQIFMSHGTPKRIRSAYHRVLMKRRASVPGEISIIVITISSLLTKLCHKVSSRLRRLVSGRRVVPAAQLGRMNARISFETIDGLRYEAPIKKISEESLKFECPLALSEPGLRARLSCTIRGGAKLRHAHVAGQLQRIPNGSPGNGAFVYLLKFEPRSDYSRHVVLSYFLKRVVA